MARIQRNCLTCAMHETECFCRLSTEALMHLQTLGRFTRFTARERVLDEGAPADQVYVVCEGRIKLTASSPEGRLLLVRIAGPGDVLGLAAALKGTAHRVTAEALETCEVKIIGRVDFLEFMERFREVGQNTVLSVAEEYESALLSARRLALSSSAAGKLASVLLEFGRMGHGNGNDAMEFSMPLTHEELASMAGLSRETVTRLLTRFRHEGLLEQDNRRMTLLKPAKMELLYN